MIRLPLYQYGFSRIFCRSMNTMIINIPLIIIPKFVVVTEKIVIYDFVQLEMLVEDQLKKFFYQIKPEENPVEYIVNFSILRIQNAPIDDNMYELLDRMMHQNISEVIDKLDINLNIKLSPTIGIIHNK
jgi:hypothetical protein